MISSIGPSVVILVTMISLLVTMGAPVAWMRLSFIGSVNYEAMAAGFGAQAMGKTLQTMDTMAFACGVWTMVCGSLGWLIFTFLFCDKIDKVNHCLLYTSRPWHVQHPFRGLLRTYGIPGPLHYGQGHRHHEPRAD